MVAVGRLASGVAHDFNNVLTAIAGFSDLLLEDLPADDPRYEDVAEIRRAVDRGASLSRQLLAFSRQQVLSPQLVNLDALISDISAMLRRVLGEDVELRFIPCGEECIVSADPGQLEQVLLNLGVNARDAMPDGGLLTIEVAAVDLDASYAEQHFPVPPGPYVRLSVSDNGIGMDERTKAHIFEPFFTTKEKGKGTGLGLSTVYGIVKQSGGFIWVYSEPGQGATFKVYLPRVTRDQGRKPRATPAPGRLPRGTETILLAEDEATVRTVVRQALERQGYSVLEAPNTETALAFAERHDGPIHLLISDVVMPGLSGNDLATRVRVARPGVRVMFMSGYTDEAVVRHGKLEPGVAYLQKPFGPEALARKVREVLSK
jgi:CheY-like chemotaxis protein